MKYITPDEYMVFAADVDRAVREKALPVYSNFARWDLSRKEFAASVRQTFRALGIKGISVTAPNYSMAQGIDIRIPAIDRRGVPFTASQEEREEYEAETNMLRQAREHIQNNLHYILETAYPNMTDRSDVQSDYFDYRWSVS